MQPAGKDLDAHAQAYTPAFAHFDENVIVHRRLGRKAAELARRLAARRVLSLGVGHFEVARPLAALLREGAIERYTVVDGAPAALAHFAAELSPLPDGLELVEALFETFDCADRFDLIEAGFILEHVDDPGLILRRFRPLLADGGRMLIAVPNARSLHRWVGHLAGLLDDMYVLSEADHQLGHRRYFDLASLSSLVGECGYAIHAAEGTLLKPFTTGQLARLALAPAVWDALLQAAAPYPEIANGIIMEIGA